MGKVAKHNGSFLKLKRVGRRACCKHTEHNFHIMVEDTQFKLVGRRVMELNDDVLPKLQAGLIKLSNEERRVLRSAGPKLVVNKFKIERWEEFFVFNDVVTQKVIKLTADEISWCG